MATAPRARRARPSRARPPVADDGRPPSRRDTMYANWGCGIGLELQLVGRHGAGQERLHGPGEVLQHHAHRLERRQRRPHRLHAERDASGDAVAPFKEIPSFTAGWMGQVCFADVTCPSWAVDGRHLHQGRRRRHAGRHANPGLGRQHRDDRRRVRPHAHQGRTGGQSAAPAPAARAAAPPAACSPSGSGTITTAISRRARDVPEGLHRPEQRLGLDGGPDGHVRSRRQVQGDGRRTAPARTARPRRTRRSGPARTTAAAPPAAACRARSARSPRAASRPAGRGPTTAPPAATTPPTTSGSAPARAAIRRRRRRAAAT